MCENYTEADINYLLKAFKFLGLDNKGTEVARKIEKFRQGASSPEELNQLAREFLNATRRETGWTSISDEL